MRINEPAGGAEIGREIEALQARSRDFWDSFSTPDFFAPLGDAWSPADNVRHLLKSNRPVARALRLPKALLLLRFGAGLRRSSTYPELRAKYLALLATGFKTGRFAPAPLPASEQTEEQRRALMDGMDGIVRDLAAGISQWREWQLDRLRLPHPALGRLTVREMLFFTLYHNSHHVQNVARKGGPRP